MIAPGLLVTVSVLPWVWNAALPLPTIGATGLACAWVENPAPNGSPAAKAAATARHNWRRGKWLIMYGKPFKHGKTPGSCRLPEKPSISPTSSPISAHFSVRGNRHPTPYRY